MTGFFIAQRKQPPGTDPDRRPGDLDEDVVELKPGDRGRIDASREDLQCLGQAVADLQERLDASFCRAVDMILSTGGHVVVLGMGKSGLIGQKIAATLASTGTPSFAVHPSEAYHGDLGMIRPDDLVLMLSYSGETTEVVRLVPWLKERNVPIIALVGQRGSRLCRAADVVLDVSVKSEVCPNNLAPTSSTLATMAMGDVLAVTLMRERNFGPKDFARFHPGGALGRRLLTRVGDVMHSERLPIVDGRAIVSDALLTISECRMGLAIVLEGTKLAGIVTDGDLRRTMEGGPQFLQGPIRAIMTTRPVTVQPECMLHEAHELMRQRRIAALIVVDAKGEVVGVLDRYCE